MGPLLCTQKDSQGLCDAERMNWRHFHTDLRQTSDELCSALIASVKKISSTYMDRSSLTAYTPYDLILLTNALVCGPVFGLVKLSEESSGK